MNTSLTFLTRDYASRTLGLVVRGSLYEAIPEQKDYALYLIASKAPENCVVIPSTVHTKVDFVIEMPHPDCKAEHAEPQPKWYTSITIKAFPDVDKEHVRAVQSLGERLNVVRVPVIRPFTVEDFSDNVS